MSWSRIKGVFFRYWYTVWKGPMQLTDLFYWPLIDILLWGLTSLWIQKQQQDPLLALMLMTGLIFWQIAWRGTMDISVNLLQEFWHRNLVNLFSSPLKISEWTAAVILLCFCKLMVTISFGAGAVYLLYALDVFTVGWTFLPFAALLLIFGWALGFLAASAIIYWGQQVEMFAWMIGMIFAPFSAVFYPVSVLPLWAQKISWCLPTTYIFEGMRSILLTQTFPLRDLWISAALTLLYFSLAAALFSWSFQKSRELGLARHEK